MTTAQPVQADRPKRKGRLKRWLRGLALGLVVLIAVGIVGEGIAERMDARAFPPPGRLVDVGGYRLHLNCTGKGSPTVVMENGSGAPSVGWALVQPAVGQFTRVCTYDRAGYAWSDPAKTPRTGEQVVADLHTLLARGGEQGPYILVAHSLGGLYARLYAARYPDQVAGMVLVDARHEDYSRMEKDSVPGPGYYMAGAAVMRVGLARSLISVVGAERLAGNVPPELLPVAKATLLSPKLMNAVAAEARELTGLEDAVRSGGTLGDKPLVVLTHGKALFPLAAEETWRALNARQAALSTHGKLVVAAESGHNIMLDQPSLVIDAIRQVTTAVRGDQ
ncbi:MAG: alpha/beta fold hydrolase [Mycobacterium leprae]